MSQFIGKPIEVLASSKKHEVGLTGIIKDETKQSFVIHTHNKKLRVLKQHLKVKINGTVMEGFSLLKQPFERIK